MQARPFCFFIQFWGQRYRDYFVDYCLPSLLAPNNLSLLKAEDGHHFLIATTSEDWQAIEHLPVIEKLRRHAVPLHFEISSPKEPGYAAVLQHQTHGLKRLLEAAYARNAYGCAIWPDTIISDGLVVAMQRWVAAGHHLVMQPTVRLTEEAVIADLVAMNLLPPNRQAAFTGDAITVPPRVVAALSVRHLHPEIDVMEEGHRLQPTYPPYRFWRVPGREGIILHVFYGTPVLIDFAVAPPDHTDCLNTSDIEGVYFGRNFSAAGGLYVVHDSDESGILSITPAAVNQANTRHIPRFGSRVLPTLALICNLRGTIAFYSRARRDTVRRDMFRASVCWHADDRDQIYKQEENRVSELIERAAGDYYSGSSVFPDRISRDPRYFPLDLGNILQDVVRLFFGGFGVLFGALAGKPNDVARIKLKFDALRSRLKKRH